MRGRSRACGFPWQQGLEKPPIGKRMLMEGKTQVYIEKAASEKVPGITNNEFSKTVPIQVPGWVPLHFGSPRHKEFDCCAHVLWNTFDLNLWLGTNGFRGQETLMLLKVSYVNISSPFNTIADTGWLSNWWQYWPRKQERHIWNSYTFSGVRGQGCRAAVTEEKTLSDWVPDLLYRNIYLKKRKGNKVVKVEKGDEMYWIWWKHII